MPAVFKVVSIFFRGIGFRLLVSYVPPILLCWFYFISYLQDQLKSTPDSFQGVLISGLTGISIASIVVVWLILSVVPPLREIVESTISLQKGNLGRDIPYRARQDEIGDLARALHVFQETAVEKEALQARSETLKQESERQRQTVARQMAAEFLKSFETIISGLRNALSKQDGAVGPLRTATTTASRAVDEVSRASREASANISTIAATSEELAASSGEIGRQAEHSREVAEEAVAGAERTNQQVATLKDAAARIGGHRRSPSKGNRRPL